MRFGRIFISVLAASMALVGCGESAVKPSSATFAEIEEVSLVSETAIAYDDRLVAELEILKEPDEMVFVSGFVWAKTADGHLVAVDPSSNEVVVDVKVDTTSDPHHYCQGMGTDGTDIWACSAGGDADNRTIDVVRFDPRSESVVATFAVDKVFDQLDLPVAGGKVWVLTELGTELVGIDVSTNEISPAISLGVRCFQLAAAGDGLLATCALDNLLLSVDVARGEVVAEVSVSNPRQIAASDSGIWVSQDSAIVRLDPETLQPTVRITGLPNVGFTGDVLVTEDAIWVRQEDAFLYRFDPDTLAVVEQISPAVPLSGGGVMIASDALWVTAYDDNLLARLTLEP